MFYFSVKVSYVNKHTLKSAFTHRVVSLDPMSPFLKGRIKEGQPSETTFFLNSLESQENSWVIWNDFIHNPECGFLFSVWTDMNGMFREWETAMVS